jgi:hypothetical protein
MSCYIARVITSSLLPDEVWAQLDPADARLSRVTRRALISTGIALVVIASLVALSRTSGLLGSPFAADTGSGGYEPGARTFTETFTMQNSGWFAERIDAIRISTPGAVLTQSAGARTIIASREYANVSVTVRITDCSQFSPHSRIPVVLELHRFWGAWAQSIGGFESQGIVWASCHGHP